MRHARIVGTGANVPDRVVTNDDLAVVYGIDTDEAWIRTRTGVRERRFADEGVRTSDLAAPAARRALEAAGWQASDLDLVVFCTLSPDKAFPGSGVYLQALLGLPDAGCFPPCLDVRNQCSGFLYGLACATGMIRGGLASRVLLVGAEVHSAALDLTTRGRSVAALFGDGAAAVCLEASEAPGVRDVLLGADGRHADSLAQGVWDMGRRPFVTLDAEGRGTIPPEQLWAHMDGPLVFRHAVSRMRDALVDVCARDGSSLQDVDLFVLHQANRRINTQVARLLEIPEDRLVHNIERFGNTTAATIPLLLDEAARSGRLVEGMRVALCAFGSGFTWGSALLDWSTARR
ncbi:MAG: beta-ketoacyl-ACP synthase 3 [Alphaproteobacteria bacterium]|nr:beta-ketoacyl-ACP synthase 3 [Alphaproteobacteria bacterium]